MGTGGLIPPPEGYWAGDPGGADKHDVLLIADEVVTGFGRLGTLFGSRHYGMRPDIITVAKGLTSAYVPLSGVIVGERVWQVLEQGTDKYGALGHGWTYSAHPICAAAAVANLDLIDRLGLVANVREIGPYFWPACGRRSAIIRRSARSAASACWRRSSWSRTRPRSASSSHRARSPARSRLPCLERGVIAPGDARTATSSASRRRCS